MNLKSKMLDMIEKWIILKIMHLYAHTEQVCVIVARKVFVALLSKLRSNPVSPKPKVVLCYLIAV